MDDQHDFQSGSKKKKTRFSKINCMTNLSQSCRYQWSINFNFGTNAAFSEPYELDDSDYSYEISMKSLKRTTPP